MKKKKNIYIYIEYLLKKKNKRIVSLFVNGAFIL